MTPQQYISEWAFSNDHRIYVNLDRELYWLVFTYGHEADKIWNFEHNSIETVPDRDFNRIKTAMAEAGYKYYAD